MKLWTDDGRTDGRRTTEPSHPISSPGAFGSGELKKVKVAKILNDTMTVFFDSSDSGLVTHRHCDLTMNSQHFNLQNYCISGNKDTN